MKREVLKESDETLEEKKKALKEKFLSFCESDRFVFTYGITITSLAVVYLVRLFSDNDYNFIDRSIESFVLWLSSFKYYFTKRLYPDSRSVRWWFRIIFIISIMSTISLILELPGPRLPWKD